ncbi:MAG: hypothetical protein ACTSRI_13670 [Promethearchaeota archaeon]
MIEKSLKFFNNPGWTEPKEKEYWTKEHQVEPEFNIITIKSRHNIKIEQLKEKFQRLSTFINELENVEVVHRLSLKTSKLLESVIEKLGRDFIEVTIPSIYLDEDGSINVEWRNHIFNMVIYLPIDSETIHLFGEHFGHPEDFLDIRMNFSLIESNLVNWLKKIKISLI